MSEPIIVTVTTSVWLYGTSGSSPHNLVDALTKGEVKQLQRMLHYYGGPEQEKFGDYVKVGVAEMKIQFLPRDEQVRLAVTVLNEKLNKARAEFLHMQSEIMANISKLQALDYVEAT